MTDFENFFSAKKCLIGIPCWGVYPGVPRPGPRSGRQLAPGSLGPTTPRPPPPPLPFPLLAGHLSSLSSLNQLVSWGFVHCLTGFLLHPFLSVLCLLHYLIRRGSQLVEVSMSCQSHIEHRGAFTSPQSRIGFLFCLMSAHTSALCINLFLLYIFSGRRFIVYITASSVLFTQVSMMWFTEGFLACFSSFYFWH